MKRLSITFAALGMMAAAVPSFAADMPVKAPAAPPVAAANWTGCYIGASAGLAAGSNDGFATTPATTQGTGGGPAPGGYVGPVTGRMDLAGGIVGGLAGCNYQTGAFVLGVEGDWSNMNIKDRQNTNPASQAAGFNPERVYEINQHSLATVRGRLGYASGSTLFYVTGGGAWSAFPLYQAALNNVPQFHALQVDHRSGWTAGLGVEYMWGQHWTTRIEYLYVRFPQWLTFATTPPASAMLTNLTVGKVEDNIFRLAVAYKF